MIKPNSRIIITGGTSGIGFALFRRLFEQHHQLIIVGRNQARLDHLKADYPGTVTYKTDLSSRRDVEDLCTKIVNHHPEIDILINNAGVQYTPTVLDDHFNFDSIEHETIINFLSPVWMTTLLLPLLLNSNSCASIVNISSGLALAPKMNSAIYCANKAALHSYSQSLRYQLANADIRVHEAILPLVDTPMTAGRGRNKLTADEAASGIIQGITRGVDEIYIGKARLLPMLMRLSPSLVKRILRKY